MAEFNEEIEQWINKHNDGTPYGYSETEDVFFIATEGINLKFLTTLSKIASLQKHRAYKEMQEEFEALARGAQERHRIQQDKIAEKEQQIERANQDKKTFNSLLGDIDIDL